jgi:hypothetical protein
MHIMSGTHTMHTEAAVMMEPSTAEAAIIVSEGDPGHARHGSGPLKLRLTAAAQAGVRGTGGAHGSSRCTCPGRCIDLHATAAACTPSLGTGSLNAPAPESGKHLPAPLRIAARTARSTWSYRPGSPSPGELSISRT